MGKAIKDVDIQDDAFKHVEAIIQSMTPKERSNPALLNNSRRIRLAKGSGTNLIEVNKLIKQFDDMKKMMKMMSNPRNMANMMSQMKGMKGGMPGM
jgi:signal recognition particle subunit SRP54